MSWTPDPAPFLSTHSSFGALDPEQLARLVDQLPILLWSTDANLRVTFLRGGGLALMREATTSNDDLHVGDRLEDPVVARRAMEAHTAALAGAATSYEIVYRGRTFSAQVEPLRDPDGRIVGIVGVGFDITTRRAAEVALRQSEERLQLVSLATNDALWDWDLVSGAVWWGKGFETVLWYEAGELEARYETWQSLIHPDDRPRVIAAVRAAIDGGSTSWSGEYRFRRRDGSYADVHDRGYVIHDPTTRKPMRMVGSMMDITHRKRAEEQLQASRAALRLLAARHQDVREDERTRIAREIHDSLGQALTALKLQLASAQAAAAGAAPALPLGARLRETAQMVDDLVKSVRRIATELRPPILDQLGLAAAVDWLAKDFARRTGIACTAKLHLLEGAISDEQATALFRIVQEALTNVSRHAGAAAADIELGIDGDCVVLQINDDGRGITENVANGPGSLGILGMRERAAALGGVLEVVPRASGGTRVTAWFPRPRDRMR
ncbi:MAG TPA: PAS domain-containing protein [Gemmatimonadales bacterium]|nr:PAS domain-containing protein [Gemmatimonadales bacterium]